MRSRFLVSSFLLACAIAMLASAPAFAVSGYLSNFESTYPAAVGSRIDVCQLCHVNANPNSNSARNAYGTAFRSNSHNFGNVANLDSDGDGFTNLQEITALTFPGNAADKPTPTTGSLTVTILPAGAVSAGAQWRVGTGAYQNSGATVTGLAAGSVGINFKPVTGWTTPADQAPTITAGATATATGTYVQLALVPNVVGQTQASATTALTSAGLALGNVVQTYHPTVPAGSVINQMTPAGTYVALGTHIDLTVSKGPQPVLVPNVVGQTQADASTAITGAGLIVGSIVEAYSPTVPTGSVIDQTPVGGTSVLPGTAVDLTVSKGVEPATVPYVIGETQEAAGILIVAANLVVGTITQEFSPTVAAGLVISQSPTSGTQVAPGSAVDLTVSKGPQPVVTGSIIINSGAANTKTATVALSLTWSANAVRMRFSDNGSTWTAWESVHPNKAYTLPAGDGYKTVRVQFIDIANNRSVTYSDFIRLDGTVPTGSIVINNGAATVATPYVFLNLTYSDGAGSGVRSMRFSDDGSHWTLWEPATTTRTYMLPLPSGYQTVRVQYLDAAGNYSTVYSDYIKVVPVP